MRLHAFIAHSRLRHRPSLSRGRWLFALCLASGLGAGAPHAATLTDQMDIECRQPAPQSLDCDYRILSGQQILASTAEYNGIELPVAETKKLSGNSLSSAILFVVDTSDPSRSAVLQQNRDHLRDIIGAATPGQKFGLAAFDSELNILCPLSCEAEDLIASSDELVAKGKTTELYRNLLEAIKYLRSVDTKHRHIILMSDGLAEDLAYFHHDVVTAARKDKIVISTLGYPRSVSQSVALQTLRRLSEETGGIFVPANPLDQSIPVGTTTQLMGIFDSVGNISFQLDEIPLTTMAQPIEVSLKFRTSETSFFVLVPIVLPAQAAPTETQQPSVNAPNRVSTADTEDKPYKTPDPLPPHPVVQEDQPTWTWFWYGLPAMVFSAILALTLGYALLARRRREEQQQSMEFSASSSAYLVSVGNDQIRHKLDRTPWRIGRSRSSELTLNDTSVSRLHAEIRRDALGQFTVQDLESLNGVFVNGEPVDMTHLEENDRVEIGDVAFTFTLRDEEYDEQEPTAYIHTLTPR